MTADLGLGKLIERDDAARDAIHVAVAPVVAAERLKPGQHVGFVEEGKVGRTTAVIGVVDPFLKVNVQSGQRFWLYLYPGSITALRHEWAHPAFPIETSLPVPAPANVSLRDASVEWLRDFARTEWIDYERLLVDAREWAISGAEEHYLGYETPELFRSEEGIAVFWRHFTNVTGVVPRVERHRFYCAC